LKRRVGGAGKKRINCYCRCGKFFLLRDGREDSFRLWRAIQEIVSSKSTHDQKVHHQNGRTVGEKSSNLGEEYLQSPAPQPIKGVCSSHRYLFWNYQFTSSWEKSILIILNLCASFIPKLMVLQPCKVPRKIIII